MTIIQKTFANKFPQVTLVFWIIKILATTLGETGGDAVSMTLNLGYALGTAIFFAFFLVAMTAQVSAKSFHPLLYWSVIVATTTVGTTLADYVDRSLGIGYVGGSSILTVILAGTIIAWRQSCGSIAVKKIKSRKGEIFYWITILFSNTLGTALGDFLASDSGLGYVGAALVFSGMISVTVALYFYTRLSRTALFWAAFILTRPLGAAVGDILTKSPQDGGLDLGRISSSAVITLAMIFCILLASKNAERHESY